MAFKLDRLYEKFFIILICCHTVLCLATTTPSPIEEPPMPTYESSCKELKGATAKAASKELYYQCLAYITNNVKGSEVFFPQSETLALLQPPTEPSMTMVKILKIEMGNFHVLGESDFRPDIELELKLSWIDPRLKWNADEWMFPNHVYPVELKPGSNIWGPKFNQKSSSQADLLFELFSYYEPVLTSSGNVTGLIGGQLVFSKCKMDVSQYPYDEINCCTDFTVDATDNKATVDADSAALIWDKSGGVWEVTQISAKATHDTRNGQPAEGLQFCVDARRNTNVRSVELSVPMGVSAVVMICAQLAGKWKMQVYVKLFALFLQIISFQTLIPNEAMSAATKLPRIYHFYNFTVGVTLFSLIQTMIFWALSRRWFVMPPSHKAFLSTKAISRFLLGDSKQSTDAEIGDQLAKSASNGYRREWEVIFATLHAVLSILIIISYIIGVIIIYAGK